MDHDRFDDLTRALATSSSRRQFLKTLAGGTAGGLLALFGVGQAAADDTCKPQGNKCNKSSQCCAGPANSRGTCVNRTCHVNCNTGFQLCNGTCIPNDQCCGGCPDGQTCQNGECVGICIPDGQPCLFDRPDLCCGQACEDFDQSGDPKCFSF